MACRQPWHVSAAASVSRLAVVALMALLFTRRPHAAAVGAQQCARSPIGTAIPLVSTPRG